MLIVFLLLALSTPPAEPASQPETGEQHLDLQHGKQLLRSVKDGVVSFDDPGFYWFCRYVRSTGIPSNKSAQDVSMRLMIERPSDFRGELVAFEGVLQARHSFDVTNRPDVGQLFQYELYNSAADCFCAVICTTEPQPLRVKDYVRGSGYFIKARLYKSVTGKEGLGPLIVAPAAMRVDLPGPIGMQTGFGEYGWLLWAIGALALVWLILRIRFRSTRALPGGVPRAQVKDDEDFEWLTKSGDNQSR